MSWRGLSASIIRGACTLRTTTFCSEFVSGVGLVCGEVAAGLLAMVAEAAGGAELTDTTVGFRPSGGGDTGFFAVTDSELGFEGSAVVGAAVL